MAIEKEIILKVNSDEAVQGIESVDKALDNTKDTQEDLTTATLASAKSFTFMGVSINSVSKALKFLKVSLIATGIGAIVVAVGSLAAAFLGTQKGIDALNSVLTPLTAVLDTIWGIVEKLGTGLFEIISGDVIEGWNTMSGAIDNVGDSMDEAWKKGKRLHELNIQIRDGAIQQTKATALLTLQIAKQRFLAEDTTLSYEVRKKALDLVLVSERALVEIQATQIQQRIAALKLENSFKDTKSEEFAEVVRLESELILIEARRFERSKEARNQLNSLTAQFTQDEDGNPRNPITGLSTPELEEILEEQTGLVLDATKNEIAEREQLVKDSAAKIIAIKKKEAEEERQLRFNLAIDSLDAANFLAGAIGTLAEEGSTLAKGTAIIQIQTNAAIGILATWASYSSGSFVGTAIAIAQSAAIAALMVSQMAKVNSLGSPSRHGVPGGSGISAGNIPQPSPQFNVVGTSDTNQLRDTVEGQRQDRRDSGPARAYVVASDVTTQQGLDRNIVDNASFG